MNNQHHSNHNSNNSSANKKYPNSTGFSATSATAAAANITTPSTTIGPTFSMDDNSSSDNSSPSYYVFQEGKKYNRHHNRAYQSGSSSMRYSTSRHGIVQQPMCYQKDDPTLAPGAYYDGMPAYGEGINQMSAPGLPTPASQVYNPHSSYPNSNNYFQYDHQSEDICGEDMNAYGPPGSGGVPSGLAPASTALSSDMYGTRRRGKFRRQAIRLPDAPPLKQQCRRRLPTPEADILERVYIRRIPCKIIEEIIEEPMTPPPRVVEKFINQPPKQNRYVRRIVKVPPRGGFAAYGGPQCEMVGGQGAYGAGYVPGFGMGGVGGSSYGYMDNTYDGGYDGASSLYDGTSYSSMPQFPYAPAMDYNAASGIPGYGMQVGSNVMHSSFGNIPSASSNAPAYFGGGGAASFSNINKGSTAYNCYPMQNKDMYYSQGYGGQTFGSPGGVAFESGPVYGGQMQGAVSNMNYQPTNYQPTNYYGGSGGGGLANLNYYSGAPPNLICSTRGSGGANCPVNLCCYPAYGAGGTAGIPMPLSNQTSAIPQQTVPSIGSGSYPTHQVGGAMGVDMPMTVPSGPYYGQMAAPDQGSIGVSYFPSSADGQYPTTQPYFPTSKPTGGSGALVCYPVEGFTGGLGTTSGLTAFPNYGGGSLNMYGGANTGGFGSYGGGAVDYGSGVGMYGGSGGMIAAPASTGSSSFGNFSVGASTNQPSFQDYGQYCGRASSYPSFSGTSGAQNQCARDCGGRVFRQIIAMPEPPPEPIYRRQRLPTPPPDIYERILVCRPPRKVMYNIVEQPTCPPPIVRNQYVMRNPEPPSVMNQTVCVPPKSCAQQSQCVNLGSSGLGAYGGNMYCGGYNPGMMMGGSPCGMFGGGGMQCTCMPCQVIGGGFGDDFYGGGYPGGYPGGEFYPGFGNPGIGGGFPGFGDGAFPGNGFPGAGGGFPGAGGGFPGAGGGFPGIGGGFPGFGGGFPGFGGGFPGFGGGLGGYGGGFF